MTDPQRIAAIQKRYDKRQEPTFGTCSVCGHRQEAATFGPMAGGMAAEAGRCQKCHNGVMQFTFTINTATYPTPDQDMAELFALLIAQAAQLETLKKENDDLRSRVAPLTDCVDGQDLPQSGTGEQSSLPSGSDHEHDWYVPRRYAYPICRICGVVQRRDGQNTPCKGPTTLREMEK